MTTHTPRLIAKAAGLKKYFGQPCINGHDGERWVRNNSCIHCHAKTKHITTYKKRGRPRKVDLFVGPPKPKLMREFFIPTNDIEHWIKRSRNKPKTKTQRKGLTIADYKALIVTHCPLLGVELSYSAYTGNTTPSNYASLDKIDPSKGYVKGNVQIVSFRANTLKNSATLEELKMIVKNWPTSV